MSMFLTMLGILGTVALIALLLFGVYKLEQWSCSSTAAVMEVPSRFALATGCMVKIDGKWVPLRAVREDDR